MKFTPKNSGGNIPRQRIVMHGCYWWIPERHNDERIALGPLLQKSGWRVATLAKLLGISRRTFLRVCQDSLGKKAKLWMRETRIVIAGKLLRQGRKTSDVAAYLNIGTSADFTSEFKCCECLFIYESG